MFEAVFRQFCKYLLSICPCSIYTANAKQPLPLLSSNAVLDGQTMMPPSGRKTFSFELFGNFSMVILCATASVIPQRDRRMHDWYFFSRQGTHLLLITTFSRASSRIDMFIAHLCLRLKSTLNCAASFHLKCRASHKYSVVTTAMKNRITCGPYVNWWVGHAETCMLTLGKSALRRTVAEWMNDKGALLLAFRMSLLFTFIWVWNRPILDLKRTGLVGVWKTSCVRLTDWLIPTFKFLRRGNITVSGSFSFHLYNNQKKRATNKDTIWTKLG